MCVSSSTYLHHLKSSQDWEGNCENSKVAGILADFLPDLLWMVEISIPHLFPANERKLGEVILDAGKSIQADEDANYGAFVIARLPGQFVVLNGFEDGSPCFETVPSSICSHIEVWRHEGP